jgi:CDP-diacylglycerol--glycerol-3-phosphate 3-phosphatidyltransferase
MRLTDRMLWPWFLRPLYRVGVTPNHVTWARIILMLAVPVLVLVHEDWVAFAIFIFAALTDAVDGGIARTTGQVTELGKVLDPLADKLLVVAALVSVCLVGDDIAWRWVLVSVIIVAESALISIRPILKHSAPKLDTSARWWGKVKMNVQCILITLILAPWFTSTVDTALLGIIAVVTLLASIANGVYFIRSWHRLRPRREDT